MDRSKIDKTKTAEEIIQGTNTIIITKNTVWIGSDVYQFKNVTGFGMITIKRTIPEAIIVIIYLISGLVLVIGTSSDSREIIYWGIGLAGFATFLLWLNHNPLITYGLKLYLPSNEDKIFISSDGEGIKKIVNRLYEFMENESETHTRATIKIDQRHARIGIGYAENVNSREN